MSSCFCTECGAAMEAHARFCGGCGTANVGSPNASAVQGTTPSSHPRSSPTPMPVPQAQTVTHQTTVMIAPTKSVGVALLLSFFFGPLGMFYSTVVGGFVMMVASLLVGLFTFGFGLLITWPICIIWAVVAANSHNAAMVATTSR